MLFKAMERDGGVLRHRWTIDILQLCFVPSSQVSVIVLEILNDVHQDDIQYQAFEVEESMVSHLLYGKDLSDWDKDDWL